MERFNQITCTDALQLGKVLPDLIPNPADKTHPLCTRTHRTPAGVKKEKTF